MLCNAKSILHIQTGLLQTIQFSIRTQFSSNQPTDGALSGASTQRPNVPGSDDNKGVLRIHRSSSITGASEKVFSFISRTLVVGVLPLCRDAVGVFYIPSRLVSADFGSMREDEWSYSVTIASDHFKRLEVDWVFSLFITIGTTSGDRTSKSLL